MVVQNEAFEKPSALFTDGCVGTSGNQQCDYLCRRGEGLLSGSLQKFEVRLCLLNNKPIPTMRYR